MKARIAIKVHAGARKTEFSGRLGEIWKLHVAAPPVNGKANVAIIRYLAKLAAVPVRAVRIVTGLAAAAKLVEIDGVSQQKLERAILDTHGSGSHSGSSAPPKA